MGAPGVLVEKLCNGKEILNSLQCLEKVLKSDLLEENSAQRESKNQFWEYRTCQLIQSVAHDSTAFLFS